MEDRYEIRGKIGQGGLGTVYRAFDTRMNREVAIKRILIGTEDKSLEKESTRQLAKEAGALASLQHPHIVTVYDVGADEDGPYVVMELLSGKTIDELIGQAPLTWADFREFALQTQEALIAAQDLQIVHRDLKPANIMLSWLPSGKFQVKIVDFGLAKLTPKPSLQTLDHGDSVFGSIYFMAPEQFERVPLDARTDMYAIGCVYYYALTGVYPFDGDTAPQVMVAHLQHLVRPLQEVRSDVPLWVCDWIMWHINRQTLDRPASARDSLHVFIQNDIVPNPPMSRASPTGVPLQDGPDRTPANRVRAAVDPGTMPDPLDYFSPAKTHTAPQPLLPPQGSKPSVHTATQILPITTPVSVDAHQPPITQHLSFANQAPASPYPSPSVRRAPVARTPAPTAPLARSTPVTRGKQASPAIAPIAPARAAPTISTRPAPTAPQRLITSSDHVHFPKKKAASPNSAVILIVLAVLLTASAGVYITFFRKGDVSEPVKIMLTQATGSEKSPVLMDSANLNLLLEAAADEDLSTQRLTIYRALMLAKTTDATDIDHRILQFISSDRKFPRGVRAGIVTEVLRKRKNQAIIPDLVKFAGQTDDRDAASAAIQAAHAMPREL